MTEEGDGWKARNCLLPDCKASFSIADVFAGIDAAPGWRLLSLFGASYICPEHAVPCVSGEHVPRWLDREADLGMTGIGCSCGWEWQPPAPSTLGGHRDQWVTHLAGELLDDVAAPAAGEGKGNAG